MDPNQPGVTNPESAAPPSEEGKSKFQQLKEKVSVVISYDKLWISDSALAGIHFLAILILAFQYLMLVTLIGIRGTRIGLYMKNRKSDDPVWLEREV